MVDFKTWSLSQLRVMERIFPSLDKIDTKFTKESRIVVRTGWMP